MKTDIEIREVEVTVLNPVPWNPRVDLQDGDPEFESLKRSMDEFGYVDPLVWNSRSGNLVGGHQRLKVLLARGVKRVKVSVVDLDDRREKALNLALNRISGEWDRPKLQEVFEQFKGDAEFQTLSGFTDEDIALLLDDDPPPGAGGDGDDDEVEMVTFKATAEQAETIRRAIEKLSSVQDGISEGRALELISADYLSA